MSESIKTDCGCCAGIEVSTPQALANRPGLNALSYRVGTHASFFASMQARLSSRDYPALAGLNTRALDDPAIALLDAWATVADVLTFYNERNVNEGYLRTATQRRSVLEMAQLVGYQLRPGVSASTFLAFSLDDNALQETILPKGSRAQSIPGPGELPQSFETSEDLNARRAWNNLKPRMAKPINITTQNVLINPKIYVQGTALNLKTDDHLVFVYGNGDDQKYIRRVQETKALFAENKTEIVLQPVFTNLKVDKVLQSLSDYRNKFLTENKTQLAENQLKKAIEYFDLQLNGIRLGAWRSHSELASGISEAIYVTIPTSFQIAVMNVEKEIKQFLSELTIESYDSAKEADSIKEVSELFKPLLKPATLQPRNALHLSKKIKQLFKSDSDNISQLLVNFSPALATHFYDALGNAAIKPDVSSLGNNETSLVLQNIYVLRLSASLFGNNAPSRMGLLPNPEKTPDASSGVHVAFVSAVLDKDWPLDNESDKDLFLNNQYENILPDSYAVIESHSKKGTTLYRKLLPISTVQHQSRTAYSLSGKTTQLSFLNDWRLNANSDNTIEFNRRVVVRTQSEQLQLAQESIEKYIGLQKTETGKKPAVEEDPKKIELAELYPGLQAGRWLIISGERSDIPGTTGIIDSELAMLANVEQSFDATLPGDKTLSTITLAEKLAYGYKRDTVKIYANVVKATNGETRSETLGAGDASKSLQAFTLKQPPLTYVAASNPAGIESTLKIYVNDVEWHEADSLAGLAATARKFTTKTDDDGKTTVVFGNGKEGARLPTGLENIKARYRNGIGKPGNVKANQISLLMSRPLGVKDVINPLPATGGANKETRDQARKHAPLAVKALDRLVSVKDYEDFARIFAGIGKASAIELSDGQRRVVHVTVAGADDIPIAETSDLYQNLYQALLLAGDPFLPIRLAIRELMFIVISANIRLLPDYLWEPVVTQVRATLLERFSFEARELGQDVVLGEVIATIQHVPGVAYVDVDLLRGVPEKIASDTGERELITLEKISEFLTGEYSDIVNSEHQYSEQNDPASRICVNFAGEERSGIRPAQLAFLTPDVTSTLILNQII